ncbi:MAG: protein kinase, partial [Oscillochloris sp.]|nr:protein kinase [Oscillochloris sp.]
MEQLALHCPFCDSPCHPSARYCGQCGRALVTQTRATLPDTLDKQITSQLLTPGSMLAARYRIEGKLSEGGFGQTYLAHDSTPPRTCVIKRLSPKYLHDTDQCRRYIEAFDHEARMLAQINDPGQRNIPEIYEHIPDQHCLVMKYIAGHSLADRLSKGERIDTSTALIYTRDVCDALAYMHSRTPEPVLHRDVKPANILVDEQGRVWLIDFGLAYAVVAQRDAEDYLRSPAGTPGYMPPEQWAGNAEPRSDIYALAATFYALLSGRPPPSNRQDEHNPLALRSRLARLAPDLPAHRLDLLIRALHPIPSERPHAGELLAALTELIQLRELPAPPSPEPQPIAPHLIGREPDLARYADQLQANHYALIIGPAGIGKTALAATLAQRWPSQAHVFWRTLHPHDGIHTLLQELAGFLARLGHSGPWLHIRGSGNNHVAPNSVLAYLIQELQGLECLIVLDDLHLAETTITTLVTDLAKAARAGSLSLLITSRQRLARLQADEPPSLLGGVNLADAYNLLAHAELRLTDPLAIRLHTLTEGNPQLLLLAAKALRSSPNPERLLDHLTEA